MNNPTEPKIRINKILVCVTEDWFAVSHFLPLLQVLKEVCNELVIATNRNAKFQQLEALGVHVIQFDYQRRKIGLSSNLTRVFQLVRILKEERPDVVHCISMKPIVLAGLACELANIRARVFHFTGFGHLASTRTIWGRTARRISLAIVQRSARRDTTWILAENPEDVTFLENHGVTAKNHAIVVGGAGIDIVQHQPKQKPKDQLPSVVIACRMIRSKGIEDIVAAHKILADAGQDFTLDLFGNIDTGNTDSLSKEQLERWTKRKNVVWHGHVADVERIWGGADIAVVATRDREGLPRSMLEAAVHSCPLIVTNIPGCRHFVRDGIEGYVVPPKNPEALATAIARMLKDETMRLKMGEAAHHRALDGFTTGHVQTTLRQLYQRVASKAL